VNLRDTIGKGQIPKALEDLIAFTEKPENGNFKNHAIILKAKYIRIINSDIKGTWKFEDLNQVENKLLDDILNLIDLIESDKKSERHLQIIEENRKEIADLKKVITKLNIEAGKEMISRLGECWSEIYQFEREFRKVVNEFILHYISQRDDKGKEFSSMLELELNSQASNFFTNMDEKKDNELNSNGNKSLESKENNDSSQTYPPKDIELIKKAFNEEHKVSPKEHEYFNLKFQSLFEKFDYPDLVLEKNRFWLTQKLYTKARKYHDCYLRFLLNFKKLDYKECLTCLINMATEKSSINEYLQGLELSPLG